MDFSLSLDQQRLQQRCLELAADFAARSAGHDREASFSVAARDQSRAGRHIGGTSLSDSRSNVDNERVAGGPASISAGSFSPWRSISLRPRPLHYLSVGDRVHVRVSANLRIDFDQLPVSNRSKDAGFSPYVRQLDSRLKVPALLIQLNAHNSGVCLTQFAADAQRMEKTPTSPPGHAGPGTPKMPGR